MTKDLSYLIGIIITILIGTFLYFNLCSDCQLAAVEEASTQSETVTDSPTNTTAFPFAIAHGDFSFKSPDNFNFEVSSENFEIPVSFNINTGIEKLKTYLLENSDKAIDVTGLYMPSEENTTAWPDLGLARANLVKNYFVGSGIPSAQINTFGKAVEQLVLRENILLGPVQYRLVDGTEKLKALYEKITKNPLATHTTDEGRKRNRRTVVTIN